MVSSEAGQESDGEESRRAAARGVGMWDQLAGALLLRLFLSMRA